jgi:hypothetical protein
MGLLLPQIQLLNLGVGKDSNHVRVVLDALELFLHLGIPRRGTHHEKTSASKPSIGLRPLERQEINQAQIRRHAHTLPGASLHFLAYLVKAFFLDLYQFL